MKNRKEQNIHLPHEKELESSQYIAKYFPLIDKAHLTELKILGIFNKEKFSKFSRLIDKTKSLPASYDPTLGDIYKNRENFLKKLDSELAGYLALARARRETTTIAFYMCLRTQIHELLIATLDLSKTILNVSNKNLKTYMPDYTYLQPAVPTSLGHYLSGFVAPLIRQSEVLSTLYNIANHFPGGIGSTNGARIEIDRDRVAKSLGFTMAVPHTRDAIWQPDLISNIYGSLMALSITLNRMANDLIIFASPSFGFIRLPDQLTRKSVIMPQKRNPYHLSYLRGVFGSIMGSCVSSLTQNATPSLQCDNRMFVYSELPKSILTLTQSIELFAEHFKHIVYDKEMLTAAIKNQFLLSTDLLEDLVQNKNVDYLDAHQAMHKLIASKKYSDIDEKFLIELYNSLNLKFSGDNNLSIKNSIAYKKQTGGASPVLLRKLLKQQLKQINKMQTKSKNMQKKIFEVEGKS